jgi:hypothetical protein
MKRFKTFLKEAISASSVDAANKVIQSYLQKKLGGKVYLMSGVEEYTNSTGRGFGVRYIYDGKKSVRFNWRGANISAFAVDSVDVWNGTSRDPQWHLDFDIQVSLVKILPSIVDFLQNPTGIGEFPVITSGDLSETTLFDPDDIIGFNLSDNVLVESSEVFRKMVSDFDKDEAVDIKQFASKSVYNFYKALKNLVPEYFEKRGVKVYFIGDKQTLLSRESSILSELGVVNVKVSKGGSKETYAETPQEKEIEAQGGPRKVAYEEALKHLEILVGLVIRGVSNALFITGRGGTGKTQTVEEVLSKAGMRDGNGYYKNTGTASPAGIYTTLYDHKDEIVVFDDCDTALADQEGRNQIKSATDTKQIRKMSWNKRSSVIVPPDQIVEPDDGSRPTNDNGAPIYPNSFEFEGKIIFISNMMLNKLDPDGAIRTRGFIIEIDPSDAELIDYMEKIAHKIRLNNGAKLSQDELDSVIDIIRNCPSKADINLRKLVRGLNVKADMKDDPMYKTIIELYA